MVRGDSVTILIWKITEGGAFLDPNQFTTPAAENMEGCAPPARRPMDLTHYLCIHVYNIVMYSLLVGKVFP